MQSPLYTQYNYVLNHPTKKHDGLLLFCKHFQILFFYISNVLHPLISCGTCGLISQLQISNSQLCSVLYYLVTMCCFRGIYVLKIGHLVILLHLTYMTIILLRIVYISLFLYIFIKLFRD